MIPVLPPDGLTPLNKREMKLIEVRRTRRNILSYGIWNFRVN